jgi:N-acetyl-anhydromuramyl-L-alanine amidase AmpD
MFNEERTTLSLEYLQERYGLEREEPTIIPRMIVLHHTVIPSLKDSFKTFNAATLPENRGEIKGAGRLNVSSHFLVDRDGSIYRLMPETLMARHVIGLNHCAIGVENVGGTEELPLTPRQVRANIWLVRYLAAKYEIDYLIGHHEYQYFQGHALWLEKDDGYRTVKDDPGKEFMGKVRKAVKNLNFMPVPKTNAL